MLAFCPLGSRAWAQLLRPVTGIRSFFFQKAFTSEQSMWSAFLDHHSSVTSQPWKGTMAPTSHPWGPAHREAPDAALGRSLASHCPFVPFLALLSRVKEAEATSAFTVCDGVSESPRRSSTTPEGTLSILQRSCGQRFWNPGGWQRWVHEQPGLDICAECCVGYVQDVQHGTAVSVETTEGAACECDSGWQAGPA